MTTTLHDIKTDIPALCDKIHRCIDRYRSLQVRGAASAPSYKSRNVLLRDLQEELKHFSSTSQSLGRSHTTLERKRSLSKPRPQRRGSASLSNISEVHEEGEALIPPSKTRKDVIKEAHETRLETRPKFLDLTSPPPPSEQKKSKDPSGKKPTKVSQSLSLSKQRPHPPLKRTVKNKRSTLNPFPPPSPSDSPVAPRKRAPLLGQLRQMSSECHADTEDFDSVSPDVTPRHSISAASPTEETKHLAATSTTTSIQGSEIRERPGQLTVLAEVHEPPTQPRQAPTMTQTTQPLSKATADSVSCSSGDGMDTLLLSVRDRVISTQSSFSQNEYEALSDTDDLLQQKPSVSRKTSKSTASPVQPRKKSLSLDRKQLAAGFRELGASIKAESTPIKYICLNTTEDDTEC